MFTKEEIKEQLRAMGAPQDRVVLMHSSLRAIGTVEGGGEGLLDALIEYFTAKGGLFCVPTHTWDNLGKDCPTLDLTRGESNLGAFTCIAASDSRALRTENPTHSMAIFGDRARAEAFAADEASVVQPTAANSCYGKLYDEDGFVLLAGVSHASNTYLHAVAEILALPDRRAKQKTPVTVRKKTGEILSRELWMFDEKYGDISHRFPQYETAFRYHRHITDGFLGDAPTQLCAARGMLEVVKTIFAAANGADPLADENPIAPVLYCKR